MASTSEGGGGRRSKGVAAFAAGAGAGVAGSAVLQPLDVVKTRLQAGRSSSAFDAAREVAAAGGVRALWSGVGPACIRVAGGAGVFFLSLEAAQAAKCRHTSQPGIVFSALSTVLEGAGARGLAGAVMCPVTVAKTRIENYPSSASLARTIGSIVNREGVLKLWSGLGATLARDAPYSGLYLLCYRSLAAQFCSSTGMPDGSPQVTATAAALSGAAATALTQPADMFRARAQLGSGVQPLNLQYLRSHGLGILWLGAGPRIARRACQQAITWTCYEQFLRICTKLLTGR